MKKLVVVLSHDLNLFETLREKFKARNVDLKIETSLPEDLSAYRENLLGVVLIDASQGDFDIKRLIESLRRYDSLVQIVLIVRQDERNLAQKFFDEDLIFDFFTKPIEEADKVARCIHRAFDFRQACKDTRVAESSLARRPIVTDEYFELVEGEDFAALKSKKMLLGNAPVPILESVFENIKCPLLILDRGLRIKAINHEARSYFNLSGKAGILETPCYKTLRKCGSPCQGCSVSQALDLGKPTSFQRTIASQTKGWEEIHIYPLHIRTEVAGVLVQISDITPFKKIEKKVTRTEKLASLGLLVSSVAHEINGPNNLILFNIPILRDYLVELFPVIDEILETEKKFFFTGKTYPEIKKDIFTMLESIQHGSERIKLIVGELTRFVREGDERTVKPVKIEDVIKRALTICGNKVRKSVSEFEIKIEKNLPTIEANPGDIEQILINLLVNAAQAIDKKRSWIRLYAGKRIKNNIEQLFVEVIDNGCGIKKHLLNRIFEPFFTTKPVEQGTGLGLSICNTLAGYLGGKIEVESEYGKGSTFRLVIPVKLTSTKRHVINY